MTVVTPTVAGSVRMGFGIAFGMLLFALLMAIVAILAIAISSGALTWPFAQAGQRFEGTGSADSAAIALDGAYDVEFTATPTSPQACAFAASVRSQGDPSVNITIAAGGLVGTSPVAEGSQRIVAIRRSDYFLRVESSCRWTIRLVQRE